MHDWWVADAGEIGALWEVFVDEQYGEWLPPDAHLVVDAGANVGTATAWFRRRFPHARIVAVEPDPAAAARLRRNLGMDRNVEIVEAALSDHDGTAQFAQAQWTMRGQLADAGTGAPAGANGRVQVDVLTLSSLRTRLAPGAEIDLLKLDTEGGEWRILQDSLEGVRAVAMEIHEPPPGGRAADAVLGDVASREGMELRSGSAQRIRWLLRSPS